ncbi:mesoderm induction early response protein 2-like isoform X2 [Petromyzon marinus]|uniref:mesoderm induction early response protein 2-like isoform X2 n=1 Tax=Petromyzon marinus TaxID=7757 RepID=UPI003F726EDA
MIGTRKPLHHDKPVESRTGESRRCKIISILKIGIEGMPTRQRDMEDRGDSETTHEDMISVEDGIWSDRVKAGFHDDLATHNATRLYPRLLRSSRLSECDAWDGKLRVSTHDWKKDVRVGPDYQAKVSALLMPLPSADSERCLSAIPAGADLCWEPSRLSERQVEDFLLKASGLSETASPRRQIRDNESFLSALAHCQYDVATALLLISSSSTSTTAIIPACGHTTGCSSPWSQLECAQFERALFRIGKVFHAMGRPSTAGTTNAGTTTPSTAMTGATTAGTTTAGTTTAVGGCLVGGGVGSCAVPTRSPSECVAFYYLWKKSERCDAFLTLRRARLGKLRRYNAAGGTSMGGTAAAASSSSSSALLVGMSGETTAASASLSSSHGQQANKLRSV